MFNRIELKNKAKISIHRNIWICIGVTLVFGLLAGEWFGTTTNIETGESFFRMGLGSNSVISLDFIKVKINPAVMIIASVFSLLYSILIANPLSVGHTRYYMENRVEASSFETLFSVFDLESYKNVVKVLLLRDIYIVLWSLLFVIPGVIKAYEYYTIPYILAENPNMDSSEVFRMTKAMTNGYKMEILVLGLSFILWILFGIITCGFGLFYVEVYIHATNCEAYYFLKEQAIANGVIMVDEEETMEDVEHVEPTIDDLY